jgi:hypothetical protein
MQLKACAAIVLALRLLVWAQTVDRNRDEGTSSIPASNVAGNGNITAFATGAGTYGQSGFGVVPAVGAQVGVTDIMEVYGRFIPYTGRGIGPIEAHLQFTTPANDKLRFFGVALFAELFLSTQLDTLSASSANGKPQYDSYPAASLVMDLDWLSLVNWFPVKTYLKLGMVDNPDLLFRYDQMTALTAVEWKAYEHSLFANAGVAFYREKAGRTMAGDVSYSQSYAWVEPGCRYRLFSRYSLVGSFKMTLYQNLKTSNPLNPELFNVSVRIEAPLFFRETNSEAIRTLIFLKQRKEKAAEPIAGMPGSTVSKPVAKAGILGAAGTDSDTLGTFDFARERDDLVKRREETQRKMTEIESILVDLDKKDSLETRGAAAGMRAQDSASRQRDRQ